MKINKVDALKIDKLLRDRAFGDVYPDDFIKLFGKNKYNELDYLEHYTTLISNLLDKDEIQYKQFIKYMFLLFSFFEEGLPNLKFDFNRIKVLHSKYRLFLERTNGEENTEVEDYFKKIDEVLSNTPDINEETKEDSEKISEDLQKLLTEKDKEIQKQDKKIQKLEEKELEKREKITKLQRAIRTCEKEIAKLNDSLSKKDNDLSTVKEKYQELESILESLKLEYQKLQEEYNRLIVSSKKAETLDNENKDLREQIQELRSSLEELARLESEVKKLKIELDARNQKISTLEDTVRDLNAKADNNSLMVNGILAALYEGPLSLKQLEEILTKKGVHFPKEELFKALNNSKKMVNIETNTIGIDGPIYEIREPKYTNGRFYDMVIPEENSYIDLLLTADFHIFELTPDFLRNYDALGDYATKNNIRTILNLGDFFDFGIYGYPKNLYQYKKIKEAVDTCIEKIPYIPNTTQLVLGGNHDVWNMYLGYDFLKYFIENRIDYSALGYERATLILKKKQDLFKMLLSHTNHNLERNNLKERIENINTGLGIKQKRDLYVFGHSHESYLDLVNSVCVVPSLTVDKVCNGAWHIRIYLDDLTISYKPLIIVPKTGEYGRKLVPNAEIIYRK